MLPFRSGAHAAVGGSFSILRFAEPELPDVVYLEQLTSAVYLDRRSDLQTYLTIMDAISVQAATPGEFEATMRRRCAPHPEGAASMGRP